MISFEETIVILLIYGLACGFMGYCFAKNKKKGKPQ